MGAVNRIVVTLGLVAAIGCSKPTPPSTTTAAAGAQRYAISGQILVVNTAKQSLSIKHHDIVGYMPAMTMTFEVARPDLMVGREPGETIVGTLEVDDTSGKIVEITHVGKEPLPDRSGGSPLAAVMLGLGDTVPDAALIDQNDKRRAFAEWRGTPTLITFIYTRCPLPNYCPLMDRNFAAIQRQGAADPALKGKFRLVSVSFDPEHDTPAILKEHAYKLHADPTVWSFLTADQVTVDRFAAKFGVSVTREGGAPGEITHNLRTTLIDADGKILRIYTGSEWTVEGALADLRAAVTPPGK